VTNAILLIALSCDCLILMYSSYAYLKGCSIHRPANSLPNPPDLLYDVRK
jgi:hypothetical protein